MTSQSYEARLLPVIELLNAHGFFTIYEKTEPEIFGNTIIVLTSPQMRIRFVFDRGQFFCDVQARDASRWFAIADVSSLLEPLPPFEGDTSMRAADIVVGREAEILDLLGDENRLKRLGITGRQ